MLQITDYGVRVWEYLEKSPKWSVRWSSNADTQRSFRVLSTLPLALTVGQTGRTKQGRPSWS